MKISRVIGIDLGTTNSVIAMMGPNNKQIICNTDRSGRRTFPSVAVWDKKSESIKSGVVAFNKRGTVPEPVTSIKRRMGDPNYRVEMGERQLSPIEVSAEILKEMKRQMQEYLEKQPDCENYIVDRVIITIPAYFRAEAAEATAKAGQLAGLEVVQTLQEPSASSAYYCWKNGIDDGIFMVYDLGGGTFDVSIVRYSAGMADVLGIAGNNYLGGDTFDEALSQMLLEVLQEDGYSLDLNPTSDEKDKQRITKLKLAAEVIKKSLSGMDEYYHTHDGIFTDHEGATVNLAITVRRSEFEALIEPILQGTIEKCQEALREAEQKGVTLDMIDGVLMVGGSTHIPLVREFVRKNFCDPSLPVHTKIPEPLHDDPDMAVGFGAAVAAMGFSEINYDDTAAANDQDEELFASEVKPAIGIGGKSTVTGLIKAVKGKLPSGAVAKVVKADGSYSNEFPLDDEGRFKFSGLPAKTDDEPYNCTVEAEGRTLISFKFNAAAATVLPPPSTLSHALYIEKVDLNSGSLYKESLMEKGTNLPASRSYEFKTSSEYSASIKIYEDNTFLCNIVLTFENAVPVGTPVQVSLEIDEKSTKHVYATAAGKSERAVLETPPLPPIDDTAINQMITEKLKEFDSKVQLMPPAQQPLAKARKPELFRYADEAKQAVAENDQVRARQSYDEMCMIVDDVAIEKGIKPEQSVFNSLAEDCLRLNSEHHGGDPNNIEKIRGHQQRAASYYVQSNQEGVTAEYKALEELKDFLTPQREQPDVPRWAMVKYGYCVRIRELMRQAEDNAKIPKQLRDSMDAETGPDSALLDKIDQKMGPWTTDEEANMATAELNPIAQRWEHYASYNDVVH